MSYIFLGWSAFFAVLVFVGSKDWQQTHVILAHLWALAGFYLKQKSPTPPGQANE